MSSGPIVIGFDGTAAAEHAIREAARLLGPRPALVVVVWEPGQAFDLAVRPGIAMELPATTMDIRTATETDRAMYEAANQAARRGAAVAADAGFEADAIVVADEVTVAQTLVRIATERDASAIVVGAHRRGALADLLLGSTSREVLRHATRPVVVVRGAE